MVHQRITHKAPTLNHSKSWQDANLLYGAGVSWDVNGKWKMTAEFIAHNTKEHKTVIFEHQQKHNRLQFSLGYKI